MQVQFEGWGHYHLAAVKCMQSRMLACVRSAQHNVLVPASNERSCLSRDLCFGVSCHSSRLCSALDGPPCRSVSYVIRLLHLEPHPPHMNFIIAQALWVGLILLRLAHVVRDLFEGRKK